MQGTGTSHGPLEGEDACLWAKCRQVLGLRRPMCGRIPLTLAADGGEIGCILDLSAHDVYNESGYTFVWSPLHIPPKTRISLSFGEVFFAWVLQNLQVHWVGSELHIDKVKVPPTCLD